MRRLTFLIIILMMLLIACQPSEPIEITVVVTRVPTDVPTDIPFATNTPTVTITPTQEANPGDPDCFGGNFPNGYTWTAGVRCLTGEVHSRELWHYYDINDRRMEYWYGGIVFPYQAVTAEELRGEFQSIRLEETPAWVNAVTGVYRGVSRNMLSIELTEVNGRFGVQYEQDFIEGQCYNFKLYVDFNLTEMFSPNVTDIRMEIHTTDGNSTLFNVHRITDPLGEAEYTWVGFTGSSDASGAILMYEEVRFAQLRGSMNVFSAGTLRAPQSECFNPDGSVKDGIYEF